MIRGMPVGKVLGSGLRRALEENDRVLLMGEDIGPLGGVFRITEGLQADFGPKRVIDTPLAESGIVGTAIGLAMGGFRPVCERSEEHTSELQALMRISYAVFCLKKQK